MIGYPGRKVSNDDRFPNQEMRIVCSYQKKKKTLLRAGKAL